MIKRRAWAVAVLVLAVVATNPIAAQSRKRRAINPAGDEITILQTTDVHDHANGSGHVGFDVDPSSATSVTGAYARMAAYINSVRANTSHPVIVIDSGDWTMGTLYDLTLASNPLALFFINAAKYDVITLGNHEFDYTPRGLAQMLASAQTAFGFHTPIVASNMNLNGNADLAPFFGPGKLIQSSYVETLANGLKVGFIGLMGEEASLEAPASAPISFLALSSSYGQIQTIVDDLRNNQGAQVVIALSHSGTDASGTTGEDVDLAQHVRGINVIASGHTHTPLAALHSVKNGGWTTQIIDAGAFGTNVARLDLHVSRLSGLTTPALYTNTPMNDATLASMGLTRDATMIGVVKATDQQLNASLAPVLSQTFADYDPANLAKGIYHPVATSATALISNDKDPVLAPSGLGDLAADAVRNVPNSIVAQTLAGVGGNPANLPGYDFTPFQIGVVATGVIRNDLPAAVPLTFADIYNVLPLGISPDTTQALPIGYPLVSGYIDFADLKKVLALQLVAQTNLVGSSFYLNFSGVQYTLKPAETYTYFKYATAAAVLQTASSKATAGSLPAQQALGAFVNMFTDQGASLLAASAAGNPYASAIVKLNDTNPDSAQTATNFSVLGDIALALLRGSTAVSALVVSKAADAIDTVSAFAPTDLMNTGATTPLDSSKRIRAAVDLYALLLIGALESQYGLKVTAYQSATGSTTLTSADMATVLGNRIDAAPSTAGIQELKEWMALLSNIGTGLHGAIGPEYAATTLFSDFPTFGPAVKTRNASYPLAAIAQFVTTAATLKAAP